MSNLKLINKLNQNKSLGPCSIPVKILQNHVEIIVNLSFQQGISPEALISLKKKFLQLPQLPSNYRPISFLSVFSKLDEKCMHSDSFDKI